MCWLELFECHLAMIFRLDNFTLWNHFGQLRNMLEKLWLIRSPKCFVLLSIKEKDKCRISFNLKCHTSISCLITIHRSKDHIFVFIRTGGSFIRGFYMHTRTALRAPKVNNYRRIIWYNLLQMGIWYNFAHFAEFWIWWWRWLRSSTTHASHAAESLHEILHHLWIHTGHHLLQILTAHSTWHASTSSHGRHSSAHSGHSSAHAWHLWHSSASSSSTLTVKNSGWRLVSQTISTPRLIKQGITLYLETILCLLHHGCNHLTQGSWQELVWLSNNIFWDTLTEEEIGAGICEMIAIMLEHMIRRHTPFTLILAQKLHEKVFGDLGESEGQLFCWLTERSPSNLIVTDTTTIVVFFVVNTNSCMPNALEVLSDKLHWHLFGNSLRQIVVMKNDFPHCFYFKLYL